MMKIFFTVLMVSGVMLMGMPVTNAQVSIPESDTADDTNRIVNEESLYPFFTKLENTRHSGKSVSILQMGDSHMQMGYFVEEMRANFGASFGLSGLGTFFPYPIAKYRPFYVQSSVLRGKWEGKNYLLAESDYKFGISGFTIKTMDRVAEIEIRPVRCKEEILSGNQLVIYYSGNVQSKISVAASNTYLDSAAPVASTDVQSLEEEDQANGWKKMVFYFDGPVNNFRIRVSQPAEGLPFYIYGMQLKNQGKGGVLYNNCGVGGAQFASLCKNASLSISQMADVKPDLVILSYGTNESYTPAFRYRDFYDMVGGYIDQIQRALPDAAIILTAPPDARAKNRFPINTDSIRLAYQQLANDKHIAYWDLRSQMGGSGSIFNWLKLGLAASDKLHFSRQGYGIQAKLFTAAIFGAFNKFLPYAEPLPLPSVGVKFK